MKKLLLFIGFILLIILSNAQSQSICVSVDCKDSVRLSPTDFISLNGVVTASAPTTTLWKLIAGSGNFTTPINPVTTVNGLSVGVNVFQLTAQTPSSTASANDTVVGFAPCPICKVYTAADTAAIQALKICPVCPKVDSAGIINAYLAAHPCPVCPICPIIPPQRVATGITWDIILNKKVITYSDGSTSTL